MSMSTLKQLTAKLPRVAGPEPNAWWIKRRKVLVSVSTQGDIVAFGKARTSSALYLSSLPKVNLETASPLV